MKHEKGLIILNPNIGQGKKTYETAIRQHIPEDDVTSITPADGNLMTRTSWGVLDSIYNASGVAGRINDFYGQMRAEGSSSRFVRAGLRLANREVVKTLQDSNNPILTMHGAFGKGLPHRFFAEGDIYPEIEAIDDKTHLLVPHGDTADHIARIAKEKGVKPEVDVTGFIFPNELLDESRRAKIEAIYGTGEPDKDNPLRIAYMMTGQVAHKDELKELVLGDSQLQKWLRDGRVKLDVYMWNNVKAAQQAYDEAISQGLNAKITCEYNTDRPEAVQIFWQKDPQKAVQATFAMAEAAGLIITPPGERAFWGATTPTLLLDPVKANQKMEMNKKWAEDHGLTIPDGDIHQLGRTIDYMYRIRGERVKRYLDNTAGVFGGLTNGAGNIAETVLYNHAA